MGGFDVEKASIKFQTAFITFASCVKHVEVSGKQKVGIAGLKTAMKGSVTTPGEPGVGGKGWEAFGTGRQPGENGRTLSREWEWDSTFSGSNGGWNSDTFGGESSSNLPPSHDVDWHYPSSISTPSSGNEEDSSSGASFGGFRPGFTVRSSFSKKYARVIKAPNAAVAGPVKRSPPFLTEEVEIVVPVEACKKYDFEMVIMSPQNTELGRVTGIPLPVLADIPDYVPPAFTSVLQITLQGGKPQLEVIRSSPIPETCMPEYLEAMDAFANRLELVANKHKAELKRQKG